MKFTATGIEWFDKTIPYTHLLSCKVYHRPEKRCYEQNVFECVIHSLQERKAHLLLRDNEHGILIPVVLCIDGNRLEINIIGGSIVESAGNAWRLMELSVLPELLVSNISDTGSYLLPVLSGFAVPFGGQESCRNRDRIYVDQSQWEKFGQQDCFGMMTPKGGVLGIVRSGAFHAWVDSEFNQDGYNRACATFGIRHTPDEILVQEDKEISFELLADGTDYPALALAYRRHLIEKRGIVPLRERTGHNAVLNYSAHAMRVKIFMGQKQPFVADGSSPYANCTTFAEAGEILDAMWNSGITKAIVTLVGWNCGGPGIFQL